MTSESIGPDMPGEVTKVTVFAEAVAACEGLSREDLIIRIGNQAVTAAKQDDLLERSGEFALTDELTSLPNRRAFNIALEAQLASEEPCAVMLIDLDSFKALNDSHGHPEGDRGLRYIGRAIERSIRPDDMVARLGGDEFGVLLRHKVRKTDQTHNRAEGTAAVGERMINEVDNVIVHDPIFQDVEGLGITAGSAESDEHSTAEGIIAAADKALYANKQQRGPRRPRGAEAHSKDQLLLF